MLHQITWKLVKFQEDVLVKNDFFWIRWVYFGIQTKGEFLLYPFLDTNHNTFYYAIFDNIKQYELFLRLIKISWIWVKTANYISTKFKLEEIKTAIGNSDIKFFAQVPGIWPKTAKKIILELKDKISLEDLEKAQQEEEIKEKIIKSLVNLGYSRLKVEKVLKNYKWNLENSAIVIQEIIKKL